MLYIRSYLVPLAKDSCQGDSGGPLMNLIQENGVNKYEWIGVVSFGVGCGQKGYPGAYTRASCFLDWIASQFGLSGTFTFFFHDLSIFQSLFFSHFHNEFTIFKLEHRMSKQQPSCHQRNWYHHSKASKTSSRTHWCCHYWRTRQVSKNSISTNGTYESTF